MSVKTIVAQVKKSFAYKFLGIISSFLLIKYLIQYLGAEQYGVWAVVLTFLTLILYFDLGITNGVKNNVVNSLTKNDSLAGNEYLSTGYILISIISVLVFAFFFLASFYIDWTWVFNTSSITNKELQTVVVIVVFFTLLNLVLSVSNAAYSATQTTQLITLNQFTSQLACLCIIFVLYTFAKPSLLATSLAYGITLTLSTCIVSLVFYRKNPNLMPNYKNYNSEKCKQVFRLGAKFLVLQLMFFFIQSNDRILVAQLLSPIEVAKYDVIYKYFSVLMVLHTLINAPLWPLYTKAYLEKDYETFKVIFIRLFWLVLAYIIVGLFLLYVAGDIINLWLGDSVVIDNNSNLAYVLCMVLTLILFSVFAYFSNGINKTKIQFYSVLIGSTINIPLSIYFVNTLKMGLNGILLATIISLSIFCFTGFLQMLYEIQKLKQRSV